MLHCSILGEPDNCVDGDIRLVSGQSYLQGRVQVCVFDYWGTICRNSWDSRDAYVVCKQLGYHTVGNFFRYNYDHENVRIIILIDLGSIPVAFGGGSGPIWLDNVQCRGNESSVINCFHRGLGVTASYCTHSYDAGVQCIGQLIHSHIES